MKVWRYRNLEVGVPSLHARNQVLHAISGQGNQRNPGERSTALDLYFDQIFKYIRIILILMLNRIKKFYTTIIFMISVCQKMSYKEYRDD